MDTTDLTGRTALVTGAGSGIGRETALLCGRRGARLAICDVNEEGLAETEQRLTDAGAEVISRRVDVASREEMRAFAEVVHDRVPAVDLLVNNAGVAIGGGLLDTTLEDWDWIVGINLRGVVHGCHFFVPHMVARGTGHVANVSSAAGYSASAALVAYATTKFAVLGLSLGLRDELAAFGVGVTAICPGLINTPITRAAVLRGPGATPEARERMTRIYERRNYGPERVAAGILRAVRKNRAVAPVSPEAWALWLLARFTPGLHARIGRAVGERTARAMGLDAEARRAYYRERIGSREPRSSGGE